MTEGASYTYSMVDQRQKPAGSMSYQVKNVESNGDKTVATMEAMFKDARGKNPYDLQYQITCEDDVIKIDFESMFPQQMKEQFADMDMTLTGTDIEIPNNLSVGQRLKDANLNMSVSMSGINMNMTTTTANRKVIAKETITTPAGSYECFVLTSTIQLK